MAHTSPDWLSRAVIYSVFVRNHGPQGNFDAVTADLGRIKALGSDIVWLMPIHPIGVVGRKGSLGSPYAIRDYRAVNPEFGDLAALRRLIDRAHALGMKVIIDVVYNHTSPDSVLAAEHPEWFLRDASGKPIPKFPEWWDIVDLRYFNEDGSIREELWAYQIDTLEYWVKQGIDGFRCDVATLVPAEFWRRARERLAAHGEIIWLAETTHSHFIRFMRDRGYAAWSDGEILSAFDLSYDYDGFERLDAYFAGSRTLDAYLDQVESQGTMNPQRGWKLRFTENHDQPRAAAKIRGAERLACWTAFHALLPGAFMVYAGQEVAADHLPTLFDADAIQLPLGTDKPDAAALAAAGFTAEQAAFHDLLARLVPLARRIKTECPFFAIKRLANGLIGLEWANYLPSGHHAPGVAPKNGAAPVRYLAVLNLEDRFGPWGTLPEVSGTDLLSGEAIELKPGASIPKRPLIVKLG